MVKKKIFSKLSEVTYIVYVTSNLPLYRDVSISPSSFSFSIKLQDDNPLYVRPFINDYYLMGVTNSI